MMRPRVYTERLELWLSKRDVALLKRVRKRLESESKKRWTRRMVVRAALIELSRSGVDSWRIRERKLLDAAARERAMQVQLQARVRTLYDALAIQDPNEEALWLRDGCSHEPACRDYVEHAAYGKPLEEKED